MFKIFLFFLLFYFSLFMVVVFKFSQPNNSLPPTKRTFLWPERPMSFVWLSSFCFYFISFPVVCSFYFYVLNFPNFYVFLFLLLYGSCFSYWLLHVIYPLLLRSCMVVDDVNSTSTSSSDQNRVKLEGYELSWSWWRALIAVHLYYDDLVRIADSMGWELIKRLVGNTLDVVVMLWLFVVFVVSIVLWCILFCIIIFLLRLEKWVSFASVEVGSSP